MVNHIFKAMFKSTFSHLTSAKLSLWLIGLMLFLPFVTPYHMQPIPSFYAEWLAAALGLSAMLALVNKSAWQPLQIPQISLVMAGLASIVGMQWLLGMLHSSQFALLVLSYLVWAFLLMVLGSYLRAQLGWEKIATTLAWCLLTAAMLNAGFVLLQYLMRSGLAVPFIPKLNSYGAISQANHFADFTALATASLIYLYAKAKFSFNMFAGMLGLCLIMLAFSGSRSVWLYLGALTLLAVIMQANAIRQRTGSTAIRSVLRVSLLLLPAFLVVQLLIAYVLPDQLVNLPNERIASAHNASASPRLQIWYDSLRLFMQSPWLGIGVGKMRAASFMLVDTPAAMASNRVFEHAHNLFIHLLTEMGMFACLLVVVAIITWLRGVKWREFNLESWWLLALLAVLGIHSLLEYPLWFAYFLGVAAFLLGAGDEKTSTVSLLQLSQKLGQGIGQLAGRTVLLTLLVWGAVNLGAMITANIKLETWHKARVDAQALPYFQAAMSWIHSNSLLAPYSEVMFTSSLALDSNQLDAKLWLNHSAMRFMPLCRIAYRQVLFLKLQGNQGEAARLLNRALTACPGKLTKELEAMPFKYWQDYLDVLSDARPILQQNSMQSVQKQKLDALLK